MHLKAIKIFIFFIFVINSLQAKPKLILPNYQEGKKIVNILLKNYFPIPEYEDKNKSWEILEFEPKKRILRKYYKNYYIFYYHYKIKIPIYDKKKETINYNYKIIDYRIEEIWLRVSNNDPNWSLTFLREDLLPGNFAIYIQ
ncbi:MAG: hypothetical protein KatS3mg129_2458 [Leptospiraceae bacterium]|nr:MAG: hypothetical protein KatS3mg129_2458 [Leptospiraceae bacterium]